MSLNYIFGGSGSGKSRYIYNEILDRASKEPGKNFLIVVPDQFTMQTQKDLVTLSPGNCIMNIDILSFSRLTHRIFEECGFDKRPILDDTGKSLVLRKLSGNIAEDLTILGKNLSKQGYIHEIKSSISEFMQYGIGKEETDKLLESCKGRGALFYKLKDLSIVYEKFLKYIEGSFITKEETLDLVCERIDKSKLVKDSVMVFDGFTGFTPVQYRLLRKCLKLAEKVYITLTIPGDRDKYNPYKLLGYEDLFYLSRKTVFDLSRICDEEGIEAGDDVYLSGDSKRTEGNPCLTHLEKSLFRLPVVKKEFNNTDDSISIYECRNPEAEVSKAAERIRHLVREKGYQYRDISIICGDLEDYAPHIEAQFARYGIPAYIDRTAHIVLNPFTEYIKSGISMVVKNFTYDSVFHFLRSGMACLSDEETDEFENYCIRFGIKGKKQYSTVFTKATKDMSKNPETFDRINGLRSRFIESVEPLLRQGKTAGDYANNLYDFLVASGCAEKLAEYEEEFKSMNDLAKAAEYSQIYGKIMDLLDQVVNLLGDEEMSLKEFGEILEAGFGEIKIGTIPQSVDRVLVGDNKRSRLKEVKALIFLGVNDEYIPSKGGGTGIISDFDREYLAESGVELSPGPREQMYIQRYYLYLNLTKSSEKLILTYSKTDDEGKSRKPAYLINTVKSLFEGLEVDKDRGFSDAGAETAKKGLEALAAGLRKLALGSEDQEEVSRIIALLKIYRDLGIEINTVDELITAAFKSYTSNPLSKAVAKAIYGQTVVNSVSRMEEFATCQYKHFLKHGLTIKERDEYDFESRDVGNVAHTILEDFGRKLDENRLSWLEFDEATGARLIDECLNDAAASYNETILYSNARNQYFIERLRRIMNRTIFNLQTQLKKGSFVPEKAEFSFDDYAMMGRIDRFDICEDKDRVYVKIIDYKTGSKKFDLSSLYYGLQMQLAVYMDAAMKYEKRIHPDKEIVPAAMLYYNVKDPVVEAPEGATPEEISNLIDDTHRMTGVVNSDEYIIRKLDSEFEKKSSVIPVEFLKGSGFTKASSVFSKEEMDEISCFVNKKIKEIGRRISDGEIEINPYVYGQSDSCKYCDYRGVCGYDENLKGYRKRNLKSLSREEAMERIEKESKDEL